MKRYLASCISLVTVAGVVGFCTVRPGLGEELIRPPGVHAIGMHPADAPTVGGGLDRALPLLRCNG